MCNIKCFVNLLLFIGREVSCDYFINIGIHQIHSDYANPSEDYEWSFVLLVWFFWLGPLCIILLKVNNILSNDDQEKKISMFRDCHLSFRECMFFPWVTIFSHEEIVRILVCFARYIGFLFLQFSPNILVENCRRIWNKMYTL